MHVCLYLTHTHTHPMFPKHTFQFLAVSSSSLSAQYNSTHFSGNNSFCHNLFLSALLPHPGTPPMEHHIYLRTLMAFNLYGFYPVMSLQISTPCHYSIHLMLTAGLHTPLGGRDSPPNLCIPRALRGPFQGQEAPAAVVVASKKNDTSCSISP